MKMHKDMILYCLFGYTSVAVSAILASETSS